MQGYHASRIRRSGGLAEKADAGFPVVPQNPQLRIYAQSAGSETCARNKVCKISLCGHKPEWENRTKFESETEIYHVYSTFLQPLHI